MLLTIQVKTEAKDITISEQFINNLSTAVEAAVYRVLLTNNATCGDMGTTVYISPVQPYTGSVELNAYQNATPRFTGYSFNNTQT